MDLEVVILDAGVAVDLEVVIQNRQASATVLKTDGRHYLSVKRRRVFCPIVPGSRTTETVVPSTTLALHLRT